MANVALVIVSHSADVARGTADMVHQMVGNAVPVAFCGGHPAGGLGSDPDIIHGCITQVCNEAGVLVIIDLGGAEMNAEVALEMLPPGQRSQVIVSTAPIVEGSVMAATESSIGGTLREVYDAAEEARRC